MIYNRFNREISCHHVTVSLHHRITTSLCQSVICLAPCHQTSQSFALPPATKPVSHLPCPLPPRHCITVPPRHRVTTLVSHLPCPLPPNQSVICLAPCHQTSQSFALPPTTVSLCHHVTTSLHHRITASPCHRISQSFALPPATKPVSHLPCPLPPNQSVICLAPCHQTSQSFALPPTTVSPHHHVTAPPCHRVTVPPRHRISQSFALPPATKLVSHLPCPLPPNQSVICLAPYHCVTMPLRHRITTSPHHRVTASPH